MAQQFRQPKKKPITGKALDETSFVDMSKITADDILRAWKFLLSGKYGEIIRMDLRREIMSSDFSPDPIKMAYEAGKKDFCRRILLAGEQADIPKVERNLNYGE